MTVVTDYSLNAAAKTITLGAAYTDLKLEEIDRIFNLTKGAEIYNSREPRKYKAPRNESGIDIALSNGVITYIADSGMNDNDNIQIIVSSQVVLDGGTAYSDSLFIDGGTA